MQFSVGVCKQGVRVHILGLFIVVGALLLCGH